MTDQERICSIALTQIAGIGPVWARNLIQAMGSAVDVFDRRKEVPEVMKGVAGARVVEALNCPQALTRAEAEYEFVVKNHLKCITMGEEEYPSRLRECDDAPIVLYYKGNASLNPAHAVSLVGTRHATDYGKNLCLRFMRDLVEMVPDVLIVSGLAYGIDIHAHRAALEYNLSTIGVLAHGLDRIYPSVHRKTAVDMIAGGGLLTEFMSGTTPDRYNFVSRNRIVAGICDATIVVESAAKGGSLITADIAESYHRDCFAFPGRSEDEYSKGCNQLIRDNKATLIQSAEDFVRAMCWDVKATSSPEAIQRTLFPDLSADECAIVAKLEQGSQQINSLVVATDIPVNRMNSLLFEMEMKGIISLQAGGIYKLLT